FASPTLIDPLTSMYLARTTTATPALIALGCGPTGGGKVVTVLERDFTGTVGNQPSPLLPLLSGGAIAVAVPAGLLSLGGFCEAVALLFRPLPSPSKGVPVP